MTPEEKARQVIDQKLIEAGCVIQDLSDLNVTVSLDVAVREFPTSTGPVDMIATGTDVKPIECLIFMRDVRSKNYFEQMKGRGTRTLGKDDLQILLT